MHAQSHHNHPKVFCITIQTIQMRQVVQVGQHIGGVISKLLQTQLKYLESNCFVLYIVKKLT